MKKGKIIGLLASISCVAVAAGAGMVTNATASASQTLAGKDVSSFAMEYGAGVRIPTAGDVNNTNGIRFTATLDKDVYAELESLETTDTTKVNYGMMIVPANYVQENALTPENVFGANGATKKYTFDACTAEEGQTCTCGVKHITKLSYEKLTVGKVDKDATEDTAIIRGSLVNIHDDNRTRDFVGMAYIEYEADGAKTYAFANYADGLVENNTRSMTYVTQLHLNGGGADTDNVLLNRYITPYMDKEHKYTIEHYFPNNLGEYGTTADKTETKWGTLNETVYAKNIAKVADVEITDEQRETYSTAVMNGSENACTSAPIYVNGNTVLKCYYKEVSNVLFDSADDNDVELLTQANSDNNKSRLVEKSSVTMASPVDGGAEVAKVSSMDHNANWGGFLDVKFDETKLQTATDGNWDYLTVSMYIKATPELSGYYEGRTETDQAYLDEVAKITDIKSVSLYSYSMVIAQCAVGEWVDVIIPKAKLQATEQKSELFAKGTVGTKEQFDTAFNNLYGENTNGGCLFAIGDYVHNKVKDVRIDYYIDKITWGVDYKAPEITLTEQRVAASEGGQISYTPAYTVTDDILPTAMTAPNGTKYKTLVEASPAIYKANGEEVDATDGAYTLTQGEDYTLVITASDWSVADIEGNTFVKEVPLNIPVANATSWAFDENDPNEIALVTANDWVSPGTAGAVTVYNKTYLDSYDGKTGVLKVETSMDASGTNAGSELYFNFAEVEIDNIIAAFNASDNFALNMTIRVETTISGNYGAFGVCLCGNGDTTNYGNKLVMTANGLDTPAQVGGVWNSAETKMLVDTWYSISIDKALLESAFGWTSDALIREQLNGTKKIFGLSDFTVKKGSTVTYYFDEISYSVA